MKWCVDKSGRGDWLYRQRFVEAAQKLADWSEKGYFEGTTVDALQHTAGSMVMSGKAAISIHVPGLLNPTDHPRTQQEKMELDF